MQKYIALLLIAAGIGCWIAAFRMDTYASFEDGTFIGELGLGALAVGLVLAGVIWLLVLGFLNL